MLRKEIFLFTMNTNEVNLGQFIYKIHFYSVTNEFLSYLEWLNLLRQNVGFRNLIVHSGLCTSTHAQLDLIYPSVILKHKLQMQANIFLIPDFFKKNHKSNNCGLFCLLLFFSHFSKSICSAPAVPFFHKASIIKILLLLQDHIPSIACLYFLCEISFTSKEAQFCKGCTTKYQCFLSSFAFPEQMLVVQSL